LIRVLALTRYDRMGASSRLRFLQYRDALQSKGITVECAPFFDDIYLARLYAGQSLRPDHVARYYLRRFSKLISANDYDVLWVEKDALPWLPAVVEAIWLGRVPYVLDMDDAWYHQYQRNGRFAFGGILTKKFEALVRQSAAVIVGNSYLKDWAHSHGARKLVLLPTAVDLKRYPNAKRPVRPTFNIGWLGQPTTARYLEIAAEALRTVCASPSTQVSVIGGGPFVADYLGLPATYRDWSETTEYNALSSFDVGIAPLSPGPWEFGKSGFKIIHYMAATLPVVASRVGAHTEIVQHGKTGFLVDSKDEWIDSLISLRDDVVLRQSMGQAGRALVEERYSLQANVDLLADTLRLAGSTLSADV
jgi:glycosyltransferase involved in cell wall biosynthesis